MKNKGWIVILIIAGLIVVFWQKITEKLTKKAATSAMESFRETQKLGEIAKGVGKQAATNVVETATDWVKSKINR